MTEGGGNNDDEPTPVEPTRRPRLTPANEERVAPIDAKSRESYEQAEAAVAVKRAVGAQLDDLLALLPAAADDDGAVPRQVLEISESTVLRLDVAFARPKKPG